ncbi:hypothetical protein GN244_ATG07913 [Phytophthora infestans]|uniref:Uncharacterized protein n=1 Tax=Phytophthora infestans TaxID=4787 RepID=A0A833WFF2_PHYIN|nr:hypothetical protein GN244_ATG07913 [Phytophthora infestans]
MHTRYWQEPVDQTERNKTGFITRKGLFRFVKMPGDVPMDIRRGVKRVDMADLPRCEQPLGVSRIKLEL